MAYYTAPCWTGEWVKGIKLSGDAFECPPHQEDSALDIIVTPSTRSDGTIHSLCVGVQRKDTGAFDHGYYVYPNGLIVGPYYRD